MFYKKLVSGYRLFVDAVKGSASINYTEGSIKKATFLLAIPMILEMAMESIFAVVDIYFVSKLGDADAVATVGLTEAVITLLYAIAIGLSMGTTALVSRRIGEKNPQAAADAAGQAIWLGILVSVVVATIGILFAEDILALMSAEEGVITVGKNYTSIMLGGCFTIVFLFLNNGIFRGAGDASIAMYSLMLANAINIILDPCFIFGLGPFPEMGVTGAAVATNIGRGVGVAFQVYFLCKNNRRIQIRLKNLYLQLPLLINLIRVSLGGIGQFLIATASWVILMSIVAQHGSNAVAGYTLAIRSVMFCFLPAWGLSNAAATLVGQNLGAKQTQRAVDTVWQVCKYNVAYMLSVAFIFLFFPVTIMSLYSPEPEVANYGIQCLRIMSFGFGFWAAGMVFMQAFNGAGDTMTPTWINFFCFWCTQIPLAYLLANTLEYGPSGVFIAVTFSESLICIIGLVFFLRGNWKKTSV
ncbi:MATE family efflux transporter [Aurantivibrio infirmus]